MGRRYKFKWEGAKQQSYLRKAKTSWMVSFPTMFKKKKKEKKSMHNSRLYLS